MTHIIEKAWILQHRLEAWYARPRPRKEEDPRFAVNPEWVMAGGVAWAILGLFFREYYWILGGFLLFYMGVMTLPENEEEDLSTSHTFPCLVVLGGNTLKFRRAFQDGLGHSIAFRREFILELDPFIGVANSLNQAMLHDKGHSCDDGRVLGPEGFSDQSLVHWSSLEEDKHERHSILEAYHLEDDIAEVHPIRYYQDVHLVDIAIGGQCMQRM